MIELPRDLLDFSFTQRIGKGLQMKFTVQNLLNSAKQMAEDNNFTYKYEKYKVVTYTVDGVVKTRPEGDNIYETYNPGRNFNLSISYSF